MPSRPLLRLLAVLALALPVPLRAQTGFGSDNSPPTVSFSPTPGSVFTTAQVSVTITWHDATMLDPSTTSITLNGQNVAGLFTYSGNNTSATSVGTITLASGINTLAASMCDDHPNCPSSPATATYTYNPPPPPTYGVSVTPDGGAMRVSPGATGLSAAFSVTNTGSTATQFTFAAACTGAAACNSSPAPATIAAGATLTVAQPYTLNAASGSGQVGLVATRQGNTAPADSGSVTVVVAGRSYPVSVTPDAGLVSVTGGGSGAQAFTITNFGDTATSYTVAVSCSGNLTTCGGSGSVSVAAGASAAVSVSYTAGTALGSGRILVRASAGGSAATADSGWLNVGVAVGGQANPVVEVGAVNPNGTLDRGGCFTAAGAPGVMYECGAFVVGHAMPSFRSLGKDRAPALVYNSETAHPVLLVSADVGLSAYAVKPDSVTAKLSVAGAHVFTNLGIGTLAPGTTRRAAVSFDASGLATGLYADTLEVRFWYGTTMRSTIAPGVLAVVNNGGSPFGAGWNVAGLSFVVPSGSDLLWVDGDGSTTVFHSTSVTGHWMGDALGQPDSLYRNADGLIQRDLKGGGRILIDPNGREVQAINRLGLGTEFTYDPTTGRLTHISTLHGISSGWAPATNYGYDFIYTAGQLSAVQAPGPTPGTTRSVTFGTDGAGHLTSITDPDGETEQFEYNGPLPHMMSIVTDIRGSRTALGYTNPARTAWSVTRYGGGSVRNANDVQVTYVDPRAWPLNYGLLDPSAWPGVYDGARTDTADVVRVWLDRLGQPTKIRDPRFNETYVTRGDPRFPALVTQVDAPGAGGAPGGSVQGVGPRRVSLAYFNARGGLDSTVVKNPLGDGRDGVSRYAYEDSRWQDFVTRGTSPTGLVSVTAFDSAGNRVWQQAGLDGARRTFFGYNARGQVTSVRSQRAITAGEPAESMEYDTSLGNLLAITSPLGVRTSYEMDAVGRDTATVSPVDTLVNDVTGTRTVSTQRQVTRYDAGDRVLQTVSSGPAIKFPSYIASNATSWDSVPAESITVTNTYVHGMLTQVARLASPDTAHVGTSATGYHYDALGRKTAEIAPDMAVDSTWYDPSGRKTVNVTRRSKQDTLFYDVMGRLAHRSVPPDTVPSQQVQAGLDFWYFPLYRDDGSGGLDNKTSAADLVVPGEQADFAYDALGNVVRADNGDAQVRRTYYPNGALKTDTLHIRTYRGADFTRHVYALSYTYDLEGRRVGMQIPDSVAPQPVAVTQSYAYDAATGALSSISDPLSNTYSFGYDDDQRLTTFSRNGFTETSEYDADGRRTRRSETQPSTTALLHDDRYTYDARGKQRYVRTLADSTYMGYTGLGTLARGFTGSRSSQGTSSNERYVQDPLGNMVTDQSTAQGANKFQYDGQPPANERHYQPGTGRLLWADQGTIFAFALSKTGWDSTTYDPAGNRRLYRQSHPQSTPYTSGTCTSLFSNCSSVQGSSMTLKEATWQYYGADERLRVVDRRTCYLNNSGHCDTVKQPLPSQRGAFEEYRYDALGRRVLVRTRQSWICQSRCQNVTRRVIWDGDQLLAEIQAPGQDSSLNAMEQDRGFQQHAASSVTPPDTSLDGSVPSPTTAYPGFYYGRVVYIHGGGIDHPLAIERMEYSDSLPGPFTIYPHENWKGAFDLGSYDGHTLNAPCKLLSDAGFVTPFQVFVPGDGSEVKPAPTDTTSHCLKVSWPAPHLWLTNRTRDNNAIGQDAWNGSLVDGMRDASGQMYMRNRYYDPQSARFTQEDPIGIAGGLNVYGFAHGDPVTYSDPYGLCIEDACILEGAALYALGQIVIDAATIAFGGYSIAKSVSRPHARATTTEIATTTTDTRTRRREDPTTVRIQAQGGGLEKSIVLENPSGTVTAAEGIAALASLQASLSKRDREARAVPFVRAARFIQNAPAGGGVVGPGKSFAAGPRTDVRVDVEVIRGQAFTQ